MTPISAAAFAALMHPLGPFEPAPRLAVAVSGGADSLALALLADAWARDAGGDILGLVVDHGLRPESAAEAAVTVAGLHRRGIASRVLTLRDLLPGPALAARARAARYAALADACAQDRRLHLLLGHHARDQAETAMIRVLGGSLSAGLSGMAARTTTPALQMLRPLLAVPPGRLRATVQAAGLDWVEDPSNASRSAQRARLRHRVADPHGDGAGTAALAAACAVAGRARAARDRAVADILAERVTFWPEGFARLSPGPIAPEALAAVLRMIGGAAFAPAMAQVAPLAADPRPATLAGVQLVPAGRWGPGLLLLREPAAMAPPVAARPGAIWDGRFRLSDDAHLPPGAELGALGPHDAARFAHRSRLPARVRLSLPALRQGGTLLTVPHLCWKPDRAGPDMQIAFAPPQPAGGAMFTFVAGWGCSFPTDTLCADIGDEARYSGLQDATGNPDTHVSGQTMSGDR